MDTNKKESSNSICKFIFNNSIAIFKPTGVFISKLAEGNLVKMVCDYGISLDASKKWESWSFEDDLPVNRSIKKNQLIWINSPRSWLKLFPNLAKYQYSQRTGTAVFIPISTHGTPFMNLGFISEKKLPKSSEDENYLWSVAGVLGLYFSRAFEVPKKKTQLSLLTARQAKILMLMSKNLTNEQIAGELGYSHSTVRLETIQIYKKLKVPNRKMATKKFESFLN